MFVEQIAVFLENRKGRLKDFTRVLADSKIDIVSLSIADTKDFGILRAITRDNAKAVKVLREAGWTVSLNKLIGVSVADKPGGLADVLTILDEGGISIEYIYSFAHIKAGSAIILLKVDDADKALAILTVKGIKMLENSII